MKADRAEITEVIINNAIYKLQKEVARRLNEKGRGAFVSVHEILGVIDEEFCEVRDAVRSGSLDKVSQELKDAVRSGSLDEVSRELFDLAVGCVIGGACIDAGLTE